MKRIFSFLMAAAVALPLSIASLSAKAEQTDIVSTAASAGSFQTLIKAVKAADLEKTLKGEGPYTIFAPTDAAFAALPEGKLSNLLKPENKDKLVKLLSYHVVSGKITASDIAGKTKSLETLTGDKVKINSAGRTTKVEQAATQQPDVMATNGVIHVIDKVMTPE